MGRYIEWDDVVNRYSQISNIGDAGMVDSTYIIYAENFIDSELCPEFTPPFTSTNLTVKDLCIDVTWLKVGYIKSTNIKALKESVMSRIKRLKDGVSCMFFVDGTVANIGQGGFVSSNTENYHPVFGMGDIESFSVDSSQIQDEESNRG